MQERHYVCITHFFYAKLFATGVCLIVACLWYVPARAHSVSAADITARIDTNNLRHLFEKTRQFVKERKANELKQLSEKGIELAADEKRNDMLVWFYYTKASSFNMVSNRDSSGFYYRKAIELATLHAIIETPSIEKDIRQSVVISHIKLADMHVVRGEYTDARLLQLHALQLSEQVKDTSLIIKALTNIANVEGIYLNKEQEAAKYRYRTLYLAELLGDTVSLIRVYLSMGIQHYTDENKDSSAYYYKKALYLSNIIGERTAKSYALNNLGLVYAQDNPAQAIAHYEQALELKRGFDMEAVAVTCNNIAVIYYGQQNLAPALTYAQEGLNIALSFKNAYTARNCWSLLADIYEEQGNYKEALKAAKQYEMLHDSLTKKEHLIGLEETQARYENSQKDKKIALLKAQKEREALDTKKRMLEARQHNQFLYILILAVLLLVSIAWVIYKNYLKNKKLNKVLKEAAKEKERLIGMVSHDLKAPMSQTKGLLELTTLNTLSENQHRYNQQANRILNDGLYLINQLLDIKAFEEARHTPDIRAVNIETLIQHVLEDYGEDTERRKDVSIRYISAQKELHAATNYVYTRHIIQNLLSNSVRFSDADSEVIVKTYIRNKRVEISVSNKGEGILAEDMPHLFQPFRRSGSQPADGGQISNGLELYIVKSYVEALEGKVWCYSVPEQGATFYVSFPLATKAVSEAVKQILLQ